MITIMNKLNIVDVIGRRIKIEKKGKNYWGICPFHLEESKNQTPSMAVSSEYQFYYCFVCSESGNSDSFLQKFEGDIKHVSN